MLIQSRLRRQGRGPGAALLVAVALGSCVPDQAADMAACRSQVRRFYRDYRAADPEDPGSRYIIGCMAAKGYEFEVAASDCDSRDPLATQPACYAPQGWFARAVDRLRRALAMK